VGILVLARADCFAGTMATVLPEQHTPASRRAPRRPPQKNSVQAFREAAGALRERTSGRASMGPGGMVVFLDRMRSASAAAVQSNRN